MKQKGFTLFELLVVISIIGILLALGTVAYSNAQQKARDSKAKAEISAVGKAFEQYYATNDTYSDCATMAADNYQGAWPPNDPRGIASGDTGYVYDFSCSAAEFCVCAELEQGDGGNSSDDSCTWANDGAYYCSHSQQ